MTRVKRAARTGSMLVRFLFFGFVCLILYTWAQKGVGETVKIFLLGTLVLWIVAAFVNSDR